MQHLISRGATIVLAVALLVVLVLAIGPRTGAYRTITILSDSMRPSFAAGDLVFATPAPTRSVEIGDVITYEAPLPDAPVVTHRVRSIVEHGEHPVVITKGDANADADPWSARLTGDTIWRTQLSIPHAGTVIRALRRDGVRHATLMLAPVLLLVLVLVEIWRPRGGRQQQSALEQRLAWPAVAGEGEWSWDELDELDFDNDSDIELEQLHERWRSVA